MEGAFLYGTRQDEKDVKRGRKYRSSDVTVELASPGGSAASMEGRKTRKSSFGTRSKHHDRPRHLLRISTIRQNRVPAPKIFTAIIRAKVRSQFGRQHVMAQNPEASVEDSWVSLSLARRGEEVRKRR